MTEWSWIEVCILAVLVALALVLASAYVLNPLARTQAAQGSCQGGSSQEDR